MYFSGEESKDITYDDPENQSIRITPTLYARVQNNNEQNTRIFLDTHLLRIRDDEDEQNSFSERMVPKSDAYVSVGTMPRMSLLVYITDALMTADFRETSSDEFKERYLAPLDTTIRESSIKIRPLLDEYAYPLGDACHAESAIQEYFNWRIAPTICDVYRNIVGETIILANRRLLNHL